MRASVLAHAVAIVMGSSAPATASAARCAIGDSGVSYNRDGEAARFRNLDALNGMNCPSACDVLDDWLRDAYEGQYSHRIPTRFYDGYVTWRCRRVARHRWQCNEYDSYTAFRFTAYML